MIACSAAPSTRVTKSLARLERTSSGVPSSAARLMIEPARRAARTAMFRTGCMSPAAEHDLADRRAALDLLVRLAQVRGVDRPQLLLHRAAHLAGVDPVRDAAEQAMLLHQVGRLPRRAGEHAFPGEPGALRAQ